MISKIVGLQPRISKVFLNHLNIFFSQYIGQNNFGNKIPFPCGHILYYIQAKFKFSFYQTLLWWKQIKCIHVKIESRCKLRNKLIEKLVFCRALQKELHPSSVIPDLRVFMVSHPSTKYFNTNSKLIENKKFALLCIFAITYLQFKTWKNSLYILIREGN